MQILRSGAAIVLVALVAACGTSPAATQGGGGGATQSPAATAAGGGGGGGGSATEAPAATVAGGGGGGLGTGSGTVHVEISGPVSKTGDYAFVPVASLFGGPNGSSFSFANGDQSEIVTINASTDGKAVVLYGGKDFTSTGAVCTTSNWNIGATSASGSFECDQVFVVTAAGATLSGATIKGNFSVQA